MLLEWRTSPPLSGAHPNSGRTATARTRQRRSFVTASMPGATPGSGTQMSCTSSPPCSKPAPSRWTGRLPSQTGRAALAAVRELLDDDLEKAGHVEPLSAGDGH